MLSIMVRPRWVLALLGALAVAAVFALLGQWQLARAIEAEKTTDRTTEISQPLAEAALPDESIRQTATGQMVTASGHWVAGDEQVLVGRLNGGESGYWVVSHFVLDAENDPSIAVARGWAADAETAKQAAEALSQSDSGRGIVDIEGRLLPTEGTELPAADADPHEMKMIAVSALINLWSNFDNRSVYSAYIVDSAAPAGLVAIDSPEPNPELELNWLNIFYAVEWAVFAGFAVFLWYRLVRDTWERENEEAADAAALEASAAN